MINVKNKKCIDCNKTLPIYNFAGETKATHCKACKSDDMIDMNNRKCTECPSRTLYGFTGQRSITCAKHKTAGMLSNPNKKCKIKKCKNPATHGMTTNVC